MMNYDAMIITPLRDMVGTVLSFIPTLVIAFGILVIGWLIAKVLRQFLGQLLHAISFDKFTDKLGVNGFLKTGGLKHKPSEVIADLTYYVFMIMVLILTVKALGLTVASGIVDTLLAYVPSVITGVLVLIIGMYIAKFVSVLVYLAAKNTDMPVPATLGRLTKLAIMVYVSILFLKEIGFVSLFVGTHYTIFIGGVVFAAALAFGLAGRDVASKYLTFLKGKKS